MRTLACGLVVVRSICVIACLPMTACSSGSQSGMTAGASEGRTVANSMDSPEFVPFPEGFPPPTAILQGTFGLRTQCLSFKPDVGDTWYAAVIPRGSRFTHDSRGTVSAIQIGDAEARFGSTVRVGGGISPYDASQRSSCRNPTVIIGSIIK